MKEFWWHPSSSSPNDAMSCRVLPEYHYTWFSFMPLPIALLVGTGLLKITFTMLNSLLILNINIGRGEKNTECRLKCWFVSLWVYLCTWKNPKVCVHERKGCVGTGAFSSIWLEGRMRTGTAKVQSKGWRKGLWESLWEREWSAQMCAFSPGLWALKQALLHRKIAWMGCIRQMKKEKGKSTPNKWFAQTDAKFSGWVITRIQVFKIFKPFCLGTEKQQEKLNGPECQILLQILKFSLLKQ